MTSRRKTVTATASPARWESVACTENPELFFTPDTETARAAQRVCSKCPLLTACAEYALDLGELATDGVFASVLMPPRGASVKARDDAQKQLETVRATGAPALPAIGRRLRKESGPRSGRRLGCGSTRTAAHRQHSTVEVPA